MTTPKLQSNIKGVQLGLGEMNRRLPKYFQAVVGCSTVAGAKFLCGLELKDWRKLLSCLLSVQYRHQSNT